MWTCCWYLNRLTDQALSHPLPLPHPLPHFPFAEGDRLSGLVVDRPGSTLVAAPSAVWVEQMQEHVLQCLKRATGIEDVVWRPAADLMAIEMGVRLAVWCDECWHGGWRSRGG